MIDDATFALRILACAEVIAGRNPKGSDRREEAENIATACRNILRASPPPLIEHAKAGAVGPKRDHLRLVAPVDDAGLDV